MAFLAQILDAARSSIHHQRSRLLAKNDFKYLRDLVSARRAAGLSQEDVAERMGVSQQAISKIERYDSDPKLSTLRRYAHAVEAVVEHQVSPVTEQTIWRGATPRFVLSGASEPQRTYIAPKRTDFALAG
ncbi:helix-turn-helix domain-containing protein [Plantibacter sp. CFBP 8775]|uniref:helix-turn-helix domain-containing protein n=1 Tax=Plantibacter sp. CFBP 8775 TaxID=2774038 RepID=UPI0017867E13|nr:helix-turn-helix transcriptional regulator [Plantibacter sp. CFBP 8775]MBD8101305.1 helix-turn-helix transcriptional regulator [Plantibacter sp. CFBP 8775]